MATKKTTSCRQLLVEAEQLRRNLLVVLVLFPVFVRARRRLLRHFRLARLLLLELGDA
jgi:hypothetical protein